MSTALLVTLLIAGPPQFEDLSGLDARLAEISGNRAVALDRRLRLARCPEPAQIAPARSGALTVHCPASGWRLDVPVAAANSIDDARPLSPILIQRGDSVEVAIRRYGFTLHHQAIATEAGRQGQPVRVKFGSSGKVLVATVAGHGKVQIDN